MQRVAAIEQREAALNAREAALAAREETLIGFLTLYELTTAHLDDMHSKGLRADTASSIFTECTKEAEVAVSPPSTPTKPSSPVEPIERGVSPHDSMSCPPSPIKNVSPSKLISAPVTPYPLRRLGKGGDESVADEGESGALTTTNQRTVHASDELTSMPEHSARKALNFAADEDVEVVVVDCSSDDETPYSRAPQPLLAPDGRIRRIFRNHSLSRVITPTSSCNTSMFSGPNQGDRSRNTDRSVEGNVPSRVHNNHKTVQERFREESAQADWVTNHLLSLMTLQEELHNTSTK